MKFYSLTKTGPKSWNVGYFDEADVFVLIETKKTFADASNQVDDLNRALVEDHRKQLKQATSASSPLPGDTTALARADYSELWDQYVPLRDLAVDLVASWSMAGCYGFVCRGQDGLKDFLSQMAKLKELTEGTENVRSDSPPTQSAPDPLKEASHLPLTD